MGKRKYIETPEKMWEYFLAYKKEVKENPIITFEQKKGSTNIKLDASSDIRDSVEEIKESIQALVELPIQRPLTIEGFENWCSDNEIIEDLGHYFANTDNKYSDYCTICTRIKKNIRQDQIEGGMGGIYNASITARLNGLIDKKETEIKGGLNIPNIPDIGERK
jgi:hypothetical protein